VKHFVAYQNKDELGPFFYDAADKKAKESSFFTAKLFREETLKGEHLWVFEGSGSPKRYSLVCHGTISSVTREKRPSWYRTPDRRSGTRVRFKIEGHREPIDVTNQRWFQSLLKQQMSFRNGFNSIAAPSIVAELKNVSPVPIDETAEDINLIVAKIRKETTRKAMIEARLGMGAYRSQLEARWGSQCAVTGCALPEILRASHIKPWSSSSNRERLDAANGLLLAAHIDALFDRGLISFSNDGKMLLSKRIGATDRKMFGLPRRLRLKLTAAERKYLAVHRKRLTD
jgi:HNH endonuclease